MALYKTAMLMQHLHKNLTHFLAIVTGLGIFTLLLSVDLSGIDAERVNDSTPEQLNRINDLSKGEAKFSINGKFYATER